MDAHKWLFPLINVKGDIMHGKSIIIYASPLPAFALFKTGLAQVLGWVPRKRTLDI